VDVVAPEVAIQTSGAGTSWAEVVDHFTQLEPPEKSDGVVQSCAESSPRMASVFTPSWQAVSTDVAAMREPAAGEGCDAATSDVRWAIPPLTSDASSNIVPVRRAKSQEEDEDISDEAYLARHEVEIRKWRVERANLLGKPQLQSPPPL
jgi:hypothetical protein